MKTKVLFIFLISFILNNGFSQIIEEKKEGNFLVKNYLNDNLEIIKIEKFANNILYESIEYLPGGKIKNGKFFHKFFGYGNYVNGRLESGEILYLFITSDFDNSWYIDSKNKVFVRNDKIKTTYNNNQPSVVFENQNNNWITIKNYDKTNIIKNIYECHYVKLKLSDYRIKGNIQLKKGLFSIMNEKLYEKTDDIIDIVAVMNFNDNGVLDGEQLYFKDVHYGLYGGFNRDDRKILHIANYRNGQPIKYSKKLLPKNNDGIQTYIDSITFQKDDLKNVTFLYDNTIVNHPQPTLVFNPFSGFVQLTNHHYYKNNIIGNSDIINPDNANLKSLLDVRKTNITNDLKKIIFRRSVEEYESMKDDSFFNNLSGNSSDTKPDKESNDRKITFNGKSKIFYLKEHNIIDKIIKNDYTFVPSAFSWQEHSIKKSNDISSIELLYWYEFMLKGSVTMHKTYFSKELATTFEGYGNSSRYENVSYLKKDIEEGVIYDETEFVKLSELNKNIEVDLLNKNDSLYIGKEYLGGIIFYLEENGKNGLIVTKKELGRFTLKEAIQKCKNYTDNGLGWYLPSVEELEMVYKKLKDKNIGIFSNDYYWSSDEGKNIYFGNAVDLSTGDRTYGDMGINAELLVIAVKKF